jgi:hypothetical protein
LQVIVGFVGDFEESSEGRSLMIRPFVLDNLVFELTIIVRSRAYIEDKILSIVVLVEIVGNIFD